MIILVGYDLRASMVDKEEEEQRAESGGKEREEGR